jgi:hypothetical protein
LKAQYDQLFGGPNMTKSGTQMVWRTVPPVCGQTIQDVVGTIQGYWFTGPPSEKSPTYAGLAIVHNNLDPTLGEVSINGGVAGSNYGFSVFRPTHSGTINREPSEVRADSQLYCYSSYLYSPLIQGKVLVQLIGDHQLKVEYQSGTCGASESFQNPSFYQR